MSILVVYPLGNALNPHSGAETRIWNLINSLINRNYNTTILHSHNSQGSEDILLKRKCNIHYCKDNNILHLINSYFTDLNPFFAIELFKIIHKHKIDFIQLERPWGFLVVKLLKRKNQIVIYDSQGVENEHLSIVTNLSRKTKILKPFAEIYAKFYEKLTCNLADVIVCVSDIDREYYIKKFKINKSKTILIQTPSTLMFQNIKRTEEIKIECRKKLGLPIDKTICIFHGGLPHPPNQEAFDLIENFIAPKINDPEILFVLAGHNLEKYKKRNIISLGFVQNLKDFLYSADFAIVPIISGTGMRIKCTDYIITALPFITTKKGIEGIEFVKEHEDYLVFDEVNEKFIEGIKILAKDRKLRESINQNLFKKSNLLNRVKFEKNFNKLYMKLINTNKKKYANIV